MRSVGIKTLKNELSRYVRAAEAGETLRITDRGREVARLVPPHAWPANPGQKLPDEVVLAQLIAEGLATRGSDEPYVPRPPRAHDLVRFEQLMHDLDEDRSDRS